MGSLHDALGSRGLSVGRPGGITSPYSDPALLRNPETYGKLLREMHQRKLVVFDTDNGAPAALGIFFVRKKDGSMRIILDTRLLNQKFIDPRSSQLPTAGALCNMEVVDWQVLEVSARDVSSAFYLMRVPPSLGKRFTLPAIDAKSLGIPGHSGMIKSLRTLLPMRWALSLRVCQLVVEKFVARRLGRSSSSRTALPTLSCVVASTLVPPTSTTCSYFRALASEPRVTSIAWVRTSRPPASWCTRSLRPKVRPTSWDYLKQNVLMISPVRIWRTRLATEYILKKNDSCHLQHWKLSLGTLFG